MPKLFISYSRNDEPFVRQLSADLRQQGADIWLDLNNIHAAEVWSDAIQRGLDESDLMLLVVSPDSMASKNVSAEWQYFFDQDKIIVPVLWKPTKIHFQLNRRQYIDFHKHDYDFALNQLCAELELKGLSLQPTAPIFTLPLLEWINIPAGIVTLEKGWDENYDYSQEKLGTYKVEPFVIAKYPVTNAQFQAFIEDGGYREDRFWKALAQRETAPESPSWADPTHPRETVNWYEAVAFSRWLAEKTGLSIALPTEMQWQWAAVGNTGWIYPYGNTFDPTKCNTNESRMSKTTPVDHYPQGASPFGVMDLSGNVWEWCRNEYATPLNANVSSGTRRVVRGGSWDYDQDASRAACRTSGSPDHRGYGRGGFRVCCGAVPS